MINRPHYSSHCLNCISFLFAWISLSHGCFFFFIPSLYSSLQSTGDFVVSIFSLYFVLGGEETLHNNPLWPSVLLGVYHRVVQHQGNIHLYEPYQCTPIWFVQKPNILSLWIKETFVFEYKINARFRRLWSQTECPLCREKFQPHRLVFLRRYR